jgi:hypothetical protein
LDLRTTEQRRIFDLQNAGHKAYGYIAHLRDLETSLRLLTSKRDNLAQPAKILITGGDALPCRVRDESPDGAKIQLAWNGWLPARFELQDTFTGVKRAAQSIWRQFSWVGVRFRD